MSCKYCNRKDNDFVTLNDTEQYSGIGIDINRQGMLRVRTYDEASDVLLQDIVNINHCPACGRKLAKEDMTEPYTETSYAFCKNCKYGDNFCDKGGLWTFCRIHNYEKMKQNDTCNQWEEDDET